MTTASIPQAHLVRGGAIHGSVHGSMQVHSIIAGIRAVLTVVIGMWPLSATLLAVAAILVSL